MTLTTSTKAYKGIGMKGSIAKWYASNAVKRMDQFRAWAQKVARLEPGRDILEVAPGPGLFSIELAKRGAFRITAVDISETFVNIARDNAAREKVTVDFRLGNASRLAFPDGSFDFIFCSAAFKNFADPIGALREMHRVLRPGGRALIVDLRKDVSLESIDQAVNGTDANYLNRAIIRLTFRCMLLKRAYTQRQIEEFVSQTGFGSAKIERESIAIEILLTKQA
jgi:ubiquinone/menaquinone biosynthesis C-methylase UbiE